MIKGQDVVLLLWLLGRRGPPPTFSEIGRALGVSTATIHRSMSRLGASGLVGIDRDVQLLQADELLSHGLTYLFPPVFGGETRGMPTAWAVEPLKGLLAEVGSQPVVWPDPDGTDRGIALEPLHAAVPMQARRDPILYERLALADALRLGDRRGRLLAHDELKKHYVAAGGAA